MGETNQPFRENRTLIDKKLVVPIIMIQTIQIIHNPNAGKANHSKEWLIGMIARFANKVRYVSTKDKLWNSFEFNPEHPILLAGGDGTVRKVFEKLNQSNDNLPLSMSPIILCPCGKANNIAKSLNIRGNPTGKIDFDLSKVDDYHFGEIKNTKDEQFFIESFGFGVFPELLKGKRSKPKTSYTSEVKLQLALHKLIEVVGKIEAQKLKIKTDQFTVKGSFILAEVMKIKHMGPNLPLAPANSPGSAWFHLVLISEDRRDDFSNYLQNLLKGVKTPSPVLDFITSIKTSKLKLKSSGMYYHIDDQFIENYQRGRLESLVSNSGIPFVKNVSYI